MLALAALSGAMLAGCTPEAPVETTPPPTSAAPTVSEEEARAAWEAYQAALSDAGAEPESASLDQLEAVASSELARQQFESFEQAAALGARVEGERSTQNFLFEAEPLEAAVCVDISSERLINASGEDITPSDQAGQLSRVVSFASEDSRLLVSADRSHEASDGSDPCSAS